MLTIENTRVTGFEDAIRGCRNPLNSWQRSDSGFWHGDGYYNILGEYAGSHDEFVDQFIGPNDKDLMKRLASAGKDHAKYRRMIVVYADLIAPLYWWKEYDTYKVGTVANSCSTMHKIQAKEFTLDDFSQEHLEGQFSEAGRKCVVTNEELCFKGNPNDSYDCPSALMIIIGLLNKARKLYLETKDKRYWWQMIQLLPSSYNQRRTVMLNYEVLANIYHARKNHKLDEWHIFCDWIESLPESWIITGEEKDA